MMLADRWHWSQQILATSRLKDPEGYEALAHLRMPGPGYYETLDWIHRVWKPKKYVEIGVRDGFSLQCVSLETEIYAIDPQPLESVHELLKSRAIKAGRALDWWYSNRSDDFFASEENREQILGFDLAFIDGDHDAEQVRRDFENLEALAHPGSLILLHDVVPMDAQTSTPKQNTLFWTGDAWRVMATLVEGRPDLIAFTIACPPTGLGVVGRFTPEARGIGILRAGTPFAWDVGVVADGVGWNWNTTRSKLRIVPNEAEAIKRAFAGEYPLPFVPSPSIMPNEAAVERLVPRYAAG